ncbi:MAG TPA: 5-formyltetrahydrofolate cyclo-ligase, partial [Rhodospirillaceae bacterium]|nr:5-formyltetrahydrofolate cyclo-ligase [Rhodospirillaceae bacterium]
QGGGYYDNAVAMFREKKKSVVVGLAYAAQEVLEIPCEQHDQKLDFIVTEKELVNPNVSILS